MNACIRFPAPEDLLEKVAAILPPASNYQQPKADEHEPILFAVACHTEIPGGYVAVVYEIRRSPIAEWIRSDR